jgi:cytochrome c peroxidase
MASSNSVRSPVRIKYDVIMGFHKFVIRIIPIHFVTIMEHLKKLTSTGHLRDRNAQHERLLQSCNLNWQKSILYPLSLVLTGFLFLFAGSGCTEPTKTTAATNTKTDYLLNNKDLQAFGEKLFFDKNLSSPEGLACAACHDQEVGWTGPDENLNKTGAVYSGAMHQRFGNRKPNSAAYASLSPIFSSFLEDEKVHFSGGNFWDGRATGYKLGNPAADQAQGPFLNPVEQNVADARSLVGKVCRSEYASLFRKVGKDIWRETDICSSTDVNLQYGIIGIAIAAFENSGKVNAYSSKYDYYLKGNVKLSAKEREGLKLFNGKAKCVKCHLTENQKDGTPPLFTDFTFENLGLPKNPQNPWYSMDTTFNKDGAAWIDPGLAGFLKGMPQYAMYAGENYGKHQVPTLRNVDKRPSPAYVKAYGHNGYFKNLEEIVHFYNTRDVLPSPEAVSDPKPGINCWPVPEVPENMNKTELGNLGLTPEEESAVVDFLKILSDGYVPDGK